MNERVLELADQAYMSTLQYNSGHASDQFCQWFAELIVEECIAVITDYQIPVGNSRVGEIACDMTYRALVDIRQQIRDKFGVQR